MNADDPLLPAPMSWPADPGFGPGHGDALEHTFVAVSDYFAFNTIALPAFDARGYPIVPPDEHVLDHLVRAWDLVEEQEASVRPGAETVYVTHETSSCDRCRRNTARYDAMLVDNRGQQYGAFLCSRCLQQAGATTLGAGKTTYLMATAEVPPAVRAVVDEVCRRQHRQPIWSEPAEGWSVAYYRAGFTPNDDRAVREFRGSTLVATAAPPASTRLEVRDYLPDLNFTQSEDFVLPASWTADQIRACILNAFPGPITAPLPAEFEIELTTAETHLEHALDVGVLPVTLADDALTTGADFRLPRGDSYTTRCAKLTASRSERTDLVGRLARQYPDRKVREMALASPSCPHEVLMAAAGPSSSELWQPLSRRPQLPVDVLDRLTDTALKGATTDTGVVSLARTLVLNPACRQDAVAALTDRVRQGSTFPDARAQLAREARTLGMQHRHAIYTQLLVRTRTGLASAATIDAILGLDTGDEKVDGADNGELAWLLSHPDRGVRGVVRSYAVARGLLGAPTPPPRVEDSEPIRTSDRQPLSEVAVAVRLRLVWRETIGPWLESTDHDLGTVWGQCGLRRRGLTLDVLSPIDFGEGDPFGNGVGEGIGRILEERTDGAVRRLQWTHVRGGVVVPNRVKASPHDAFSPGDPLDGEDGVAAGIARRLRVSDESPAAGALAALRVAAISTHWFWLVVEAEENLRAIGSTPDAGGHLHEAVRKLQGRPKPLFTVYPDAEVWCRAIRVLT